MNLKEYIKEHYDVTERIKHLKSDPLQNFLDSDIFPCDYVISESGVLVKMLKFADGDREISVLDLLSYEREDLVRKNDIQLLELFDVYTAQFSLEDNLNISLKDMRRKFLENKMGLE